MSVYGKVPTIDVCVEDTKLMMHFLYKHKGDPNFAMVEVLRLFKTYQASYRVIQVILDSFLNTYKLIVNKRQASTTIQQFSKHTKIPEKWLKENYFTANLGHFPIHADDRDYISMGLYIEA